MNKLTFKTRLTFFMIIAKFFVMIYLSVKYASGFFTDEQVLSLIILQLPLLVVYFASMIVSKADSTESEKLIHCSYARPGHLLFLFYPLIILLALYFGDFYVILAALSFSELLLSMYIGVIILIIFTEKDFNINKN